MQKHLKGERIPQIAHPDAAPDSPVPRPLLVPVQLGNRQHPMILRLDSGANVPQLYVNTLDTAPWVQRQTHCRAVSPEKRWNSSRCAQAVSRQNAIGTRQAPFWAENRPSAVPSYPVERNHPQCMRATVRRRSRGLLPIAHTCPEVDLAKVGCAKSNGLRSEAVSMMQAAQSRDRKDSAIRRWILFRLASGGGFFAKAEVGAVLVIIGDEFVHEPLQMATIRPEPRRECIALFSLTIVKLG